MRCITYLDRQGSNGGGLTAQLKPEKKERSTRCRDLAWEAAMTLREWKLGADICWLIGVGICLTLWQPPSASGQTVHIADALGAAKEVKMTERRPMWLPPDVDKEIPQVEIEESCPLDEILQNAEERILEFVRNVDRFTATESLTHQSINKHGQASAPVRRKFDYVVSIHEVRRGHLGVTEYRNGGLALDEFPSRIVTSGLPTLVLIFHPYYAPSYEMTCEGLARSNDQLAWQVHFRQRADKPNELKTYQSGIQGRSYPVGLKGRAWISADSYQIVKMETDLAAPAPQIRLLAEHTAVEYGPVKFREGDVNLWLPRSAEVYFVWRGQQVHRRHSFDQYMLFTVDDKQRINAPPAM
jgi:hypothetical protein